MLQATHPDPTLCYCMLGYQSDKGLLYKQAQLRSTGDYCPAGVFEHSEVLKVQSLLSVRVRLISEEKKLRPCGGPISMGAWFL